MQTFPIKDGIQLHYVETGKFKTNLIGVYFYLPMDENITKASLISSMIARGIEDQLPTPDLNNRMQELFGARAETEIRKKGDGAVLCVLFDYVNPKFADNAPILEGILELLETLVFHQRFGAQYLEQEKENLKNSILALVNDKRAYAGERLIEEMCKGEPYSLNELGRIEDIPQITIDVLQQYYEQVLLKSPVDFFVTGETEIEPLRSAFARMTQSITVTQTIPESSIRTTVAEVQEVVETQPIAQGKLNMGFRTKTMATDRDYTALVVMNGIFGGGVFSKLFNNVREKLSLCYYVYSRLDKYKGIMTVGSGIEFDSVDKARAEILKQFEDVKNGVISDVEYSSAILGIVNNFRSINDSAILIQDYYIGNLISGQELTLEQYAEAVKKITVEDVVRVAKKVELDTVYFLKGAEA